MPKVGFLCKIERRNMVEKKLPVTNDYIFKKIFSKKGNESMLKDFLIAVLEIPIEKVAVQILLKEPYTIGLGIIIII